MFVPGPCFADLSGICEARIQAPRAFRRGAPDAGAHWFRQGKSADIFIRRTDGVGR